MYSVLLSTLVGLLLGLAIGSFRKPPEGKSRRDYRWKQVLVFGLCGAIHGNIVAISVSLIVPDRTVVMSSTCAVRVPGSSGPNAFFVANGKDAYTIFTRNQDGSISPVNFHASRNVRIIETSSLVNEAIWTTYGALPDRSSAYFYWSFPGSNMPHPVLDEVLIPADPKAVATRQACP